MLKWHTGNPSFKKLCPLILAILALVLVYAIIHACIPASAGNERLYIEHTVQPGETLWQIARHYRPDADPRQVVWEIKQASGCDSVIYPGQVVRVPK